MKKVLLMAIMASFLAVSCKSGGKGSAAAGAAEENGTPISGGAIAYVQIDSLITKYDMYNELRGVYEEKAKKADAELTSKGRALERDMMDYQEKMQNGLVTRAEAMKIEENLNRKQQNFVQQRDKVMGELAEEEQVLMNKIQHSITQYLKEYNKDNRYSVILSTTGGGPILVADPTLDITVQVLEALNKDYAANKPKAETK